MYTKNGVTSGSDNADMKSSWIKKKLDSSLTAIVDNTPEPDNFMYAGTYDASSRVFDVEKYGVADKFTTKPSIDDRGFATEQQPTSEEVIELDVSVRALFNKLTIQDIVKELNPLANYVRTYVVLDAENCLENIGNNTLVTPYYISWYYSYSNNYQRGAISSFGDVGKIVGLRIITLYMPTRSADYYGGGTIIDSTLSIAFEEFSAQSIISQSGRKFHFTLVQVPVDFDNFVPINEYYWFKKPITQLDKLTISLGNPDRIIPIYIGRMLVSNLRIDFQAGNPSSFKLTYQGFAVYQTGDRIFITGFSTSDPVGDAAVIAAINNPAGLICTKIAPDEISIPVDSTGIAVYPVSPAYTCYIYNPRIRRVLSMEIIYDKTAISS